MAPNTQTVEPCAICTYFDVQDCQQGIHRSVGIGLVCGDCKPFTELAFEELAVTPGIASAVIPDGHRNNKRRRKSK